MNRPYLKISQSNQEYAFSELAQYNAEVSRGLVHTEAWMARMAEMQRAFNLTAYGTETGLPGSVVPATIVKGMLVPLKR